MKRLCEAARRSGGGAARGESLSLCLSVCLSLSLSLCLCLSLFLSLFLFLSMFLFLSLYLSVSLSLCLSISLSLCLSVSLSLSPARLPVRVCRDGAARGRGVWLGGPAVEGSACHGNERAVAFTVACGGPCARSLKTVPARSSGLSPRSGPPSSPCLVTLPSWSCHSAPDNSRVSGSRSYCGICIIASGP